MAAPPKGNRMGSEEILFVEHDEAAVVTDKAHCGDCVTTATDTAHCGTCFEADEVTDKAHCGDCF